MLGLEDSGRGTRGRGTRGLVEVINKSDFCAEFVKYNFRWSRERCNMLESLSVVADDFQRPGSAAVFSSGQFDYTGLRLPVPSRLNILVWRAFLQDCEDRVICDFLKFGWPLGYTN